MIHLDSFADEIVKLGSMIKEAPFKSQAQRRKFYAMEASGEISKKTLKKWVDATPKGKKLPERVKKADGLEKAGYESQDYEFRDGRLFEVFGGNRPATMTFARSKGLTPIPDPKLPHLKDVFIAEREITDLDEMRQVADNMIEANQASIRYYEREQEKRRVKSTLAKTYIGAGALGGGLAGLLLGRRVVPGVPGHLARAITGTAGAALGGLGGLALAEHVTPKRSLRNGVHDEEIKRDLKSEIGVWGKFKAGLPERVKKAEVDMDMFALGFFKQSVSVVNLVKGLAGRAMNAASPYAKRILAPLEGLKNKVVGAAGAGGAQVPESGRAATKELVHRVGQYLPKGGNFNPLEVMRRSYSAVAPVMHKARLARPPMRPSPVSVPREKFVSNSRWQGSSQ